MQKGACAPIVAKVYREAGGAAGVGRATTDTVVQTVVSVIVADLVFTGIFYSIGLT